jgi:hypothetical protein
VNPRTGNLVQKLEALSPEQIATVEEFVEFVRMRGRERALVNAAGAASEPSFSAVWNNPEDDAYDAL